MRINSNAKKIISSLVIASAITLPMGNVTLAKQESSTHKEVKVYFNDEKIEFDQEPIIVDGRTKVPFRAIFETMGTIVYYRDSDKSILGLTRDGDVIEHQVGTNIAIVNGVEKTYDTVSQIVNDRTLIPVRMVSDLLCASVEWKEKEREVLIEKELQNNQYYEKIRGIMECALDQNFNPENYKRYLTYQNMHWDMDPKQVVINVNMDLDRELIEVDGIGVIPGKHLEAKPEDIKTIKDTDNILMLINKFNKLPDDYAANNLVTANVFPEIPLTRRTMHPDVYTNFKIMYDAAQKDGITLEVTGALQEKISMETQRAYALEQEQYAYSIQAAHGFSELQTGLALNIECTEFCGGLFFTYSKENNIIPRAPFGGDKLEQEIFDQLYDQYLSELAKEQKVYDWLDNNCYKYGFIRRYPKGKEHITRYSYMPWSIRYVGHDVAKIIHDENLCLEEYWAKYLNPSEYKTDLESTKQKVLKMK